MIASSGRIQIVKAQPGIGDLSIANLTFTLSNAEDADSGEFSCVASADIPGIGSLADTVNFTITVLGKEIYNRSLLAFLCACFFTKIITTSDSVQLRHGIRFQQRKAMNLIIEIFMT